jgi:hypothetical protein
VQKIVDETDWITITIGETSTYKVNQNDLPYTIKADYRTGSKFKHNIYGEGIVVNTSNGKSGKGDLNGKLDWVEVKFDKGYVSKGKYYDTRKITNVFTSSSMGIS